MYVETNFTIVNIPGGGSPRTTNTLAQRTPSHNEHPRATNTLAQRTPSHNEHPRTTNTLAQRTPSHNEHPRTTNTLAVVPFTIVLGARVHIRHKRPLRPLRDAVRWKYPNWVSRVGDKTLVKTDEKTISHRPRNQASNTDQLTRVV